MLKFERRYEGYKQLSITQVELMSRLLERIRAVKHVGKVTELMASQSAKFVLTFNSTVTKRELDQVERVIDVFYSEHIPEDTGFTVSIKQGVPNGGLVALGDHALAIKVKLN